MVQLIGLARSIANSRKGQLGAPTAWGVIAARSSSTFLCSSAVRLFIIQAQLWAAGGAGTFRSSRVLR